MLRQREPRYRNRALLDLAYQLPCQIQIPDVCEGTTSNNPGACEPAHSNWSRHGKGKSMKAHDVYFAASCRACHRELDQGKKYDGFAREHYWQTGFERTLLELFRRGLVICANGEPGGIVIPTGHTLTISPTRKPRKRSAKTGHANGHSTAATSKTFQHPNKRQP